MGSDSPFVIREVLLEGDEGEKSARMMANAPIPIGSEVSLSGRMLSLPLLHYPAAHSCIYASTVFPLFSSSSHAIDVSPTSVAS